MATWQEVRERLSSTLEKHGFECHPFKVGWYNEHVQPFFRLDYNEDTLAFVVISTPSFFEKSFIPFLVNHEGTDCRQDLLDQCISHHFRAAAAELSENETDLIYDYEMRVGTRRPKVLVQTAGHVSGAVHFYQKSCVSSPPWPPNQVISGVCLHPKYGGWFALRGVIIFKDVLVADLQRKQPEDILQDENKIIDLLNLFNFHWKDWRFRDVVEPAERYSEIQRQYFSTPPSERAKLVSIIKERNVNHC